LYMMKVRLGRTLDVSRRKNFSSTLLGSVASVLHIKLTRERSTREKTHTFIDIE
jgi:hypothetical protein